MGKRVIGAVLLLVLGVTALLAVYYLLPLWKDREQKLVSDAGKVQGKITIALDNWAGYFILRSPMMKQEMRRLGWRLVVEDDQGDTLRRMNRLRQGEIDAAAVTVDSFLGATAVSGVPGVIIMVVDESKGGDAILARRDRVPDLDAMRNRPNTSVAFTPNSPSHYLLKAVSHHFAVAELVPPRGPLRIETKGSPEALERLLSGKADIAALWEPDVARGLADPAITKILGTESTEKLIVDVLALNTAFAQKNPEAVQTLVRVYFKCLKDYRLDPGLLNKDAAADMGVSESVAETVIKGVRWINLTENAEEWFGIKGVGVPGADGLVRAIDSTITTLIHAGDFATNPLPGGDSYRAINSAFLEAVYAKNVAGFVSGPKQSEAAGSLEARFQPLTDAQWKGLSRVGALKIESVMFQPGSSVVGTHAKEVIDEAVELLRHYPTFRILVRGHTGTAGDPEQNRILSQERAEVVARYMEVTYRIDPNRIKAAGYGGAEPLARTPNESQRAYDYRLPRVELALMRETL